MFYDCFGSTSKRIGLVTVFGTILTGRQSGQKLQCLYGNPMVNNFFIKIEFYKTCESLGGRFYSPNVKGVAWLERAQLSFSNFSYICL